MAFKLSSKNDHNNVVQKLKEMTDIHQKNRVKEKHLNKQTLGRAEKSILGLPIIAHLNKFQVSDEWHT